MDPLFEVHQLNESGIGKAQVIALEFNAFLCRIEGIVGTEANGPSRELSIVRTKLEEACFFAKKYMARQKENQK